MKDLKLKIDKNNLYESLSKSVSLNKYLTIKRIFDLFFVISIIPIAIPALIFGMILIKLCSEGPIFFIQERVGANCNPFFIYKLRTMYYQPNNNDLNHTTKDDKRIFKAGKLLRLTKIDEIPQFLNILKGDMSLIGPRPERVEIVKILSKEIPNYKLRHLIKPGLSGLAQINNPVATPNESIEKLEYDLYYVSNFNFFLDLRILVRTFFIVLRLESL
jgi:lipopolysaccharide/colanic/teichoic acid biosynthesis glycosyltransferase